MAKLHNQTKSDLSWRMSGKQYSCEPWGPVEIPDKLVDICLRQGLELGPAPVSPEVRAQQRVEDEKAASEDEAVSALRSRAESAEGQLKSFAAEVEKLRAQLSDALSRNQAGSEHLAKLTESLEKQTAEKGAAEELLAENTRLATAAEERAVKAEALVAELKEKSK